MTFLNVHTAVLFFVRIIVDVYTMETVVVASLLGTLMYGIAFSYATFATLYLQYYHEDFKQYFVELNRHFHLRSAKGEMQNSLC